MDDAWVGNNTFLGHFFRQLSKPTTQVYITYGSLIRDEDYKTLQQRTREQIDNMLGELQQNAPFKSGFSS